MLISHPIPLRHLRELASKLEVLSDMLRYYMSFVLRSCQLERHPTTQQVYDNRQVGLERSLRHHEREQHGGTRCTCPIDDMAEDEIDCP